MPQPCGKQLENHEVGRQVLKSHGFTPVRQKAWCHISIPRGFTPWCRDTSCVPLIPRGKLQESRDSTRMTPKNMVRGATSAPLASSPFHDTTYNGAMPTTLTTSSRNLTVSPLDTATHQANLTVLPLCTLQSHLMPRERPKRVFPAQIQL